MGKQFNTKSLIYAIMTVAVGLLASPDTRALDCDGMIVPDEDALTIANLSFAGEEIRVSKRKTLVVNWVQSVSGSYCEVMIETNVTLRRKVRRDAHGTMTLVGQLALVDGDPCIVDTRIEDFSLSHTLVIGEFFYEKMAGTMDLCL